MSQISQNRARSNIKQINELVEFMVQHSEFALGSFSGPMGKQQHERLWMELAAHLSAFGPTKTSAQCKTSWRDLRSKVRAKNAKIAKARTATGNNIPIPTLNDWEQKILSIIGTASSEGVGIPETSIERNEVSQIFSEHSSPEEFIMEISTNEQISSTLAEVEKDFAERNKIEAERNEILKAFHLSVEKLIDKAFPLGPSDI